MYKGQNNIIASDCKQQDTEVHSSATLSGFAMSTHTYPDENLEDSNFTRIYQRVFHPFGDYVQVIKFSFTIKWKVLIFIEANSTHTHTSPTPENTPLQNEAEFVFYLFRHFILISKTSYFF